MSKYIPFLVGGIIAYTSHLTDNLYLQILGGVVAIIATFTLTSIISKKEQTK